MAEQVMTATPLTLSRLDYSIRDMFDDLAVPFVMLRVSPGK